MDSLRLSRSVTVAAALSVPVAAIVALAIVAFLPKGEECSSTGGCRDLPSWAESPTVEEPVVIYLLAGFAVCAGVAAAALWLVRERRGIMILLLLTAVLIVGSFFSVLGIVFVLSGLFALVTSIAGVVYLARSGGPYLPGLGQPAEAKKRGRRSRRRKRRKG